MDVMSEEHPSDPFGGAFGGGLNDVPLFREIQRVLMASTGPVNWELARQVGVATAAWGSDEVAPTEQDRAGLEQTVRASELAVADFTALPMPTDVARVEAYRRAQWVEANIASLREIVEPIAAKLSASLGQLDALGTLPGMPELRDAPPGDATGGPEMAQMLNLIGPLLMGTQVGTVLGQLGQRVLGQYDLAIPRHGGSIYFVVPNLARFEQEWDLPPIEFRAWVALHEVTHRFEFARPWAREHFLGLVRDLVDHSEIDLSGLRDRLESMDFGNPEAMSEAFAGVGNLFGDQSSAEQRLRIARLQAFMAATEGYSEHVMDAVGQRMLSSYPKIEEAVRRHRDGRAGDQALERFLGLEMKLEQYRMGRAFCDRVVELTEEATLSRMWGTADSLPSMPELEEPTLWLSRMA